MPTKKTASPKRPRTNPSASSNSSPHYKQGGEMAERMLSECPVEHWADAINGFRDRIASEIKSSQAKVDAANEHLGSASAAAL